jgi:hypothetical protein
MPLHETKASALSSRNRRKLAYEITTLCVSVCLFLTPFQLLCQLTCCTKIDISIMPCYQVVVSVRVFVCVSSFQLSNQLTSFHETVYQRYATGGRPIAVLSSSIRTHQLGEAGAALTPKWCTVI